MNNIWFISDTHFGHTNILQFESAARPFASLDEMHEAMIERWNSVVKPNDTVWHLGDFCFGQQYIKIAERLNGKKRLVMGNHDKYDVRNYAQYFERIFGMVYWEKCVLSHMPVHTAQFGGRWWVNVHGHLHSKLMQVEHPFIGEDRRYFNVSVEQNNLTPISADLIRDRVKEVKIDGAV